MPNRKSEAVSFFPSVSSIDPILPIRSKSIPHRRSSETKMVVEETIKAASTEDLSNSIANLNLNLTGRGGAEEDEELEEGEIVGDGDLDSSNLSAAIVHQPHPLEHSWTFWFDNPSAKSRQATWGASIRPIYTFSSVEEFWSVYNNIHHPSKLALRADLYCFKHNIEPKWEDPVCATGGKWTVNFSRGKSDNGWLYTLLAMIGEQFDCGDEICGAVVNVRSGQDKISIWTKNASIEAAQVSIGKQWKEFLDCNDTIGFIFHDDAKKLERHAKNKYTV